MNALNIFYDAVMPIVKLICVENYLGNISFNLGGCKFMNILIFIIFGSSHALCKPSDKLVFGHFFRLGVIL